MDLAGKIGKKMLKRLNDALPELVLGILLYGIAVWFVGVWFVTDKLHYSTGLLIGIALAVGMAVNMAVVLRDAVELYGGKHAQAKIIAKSVVRYLVVVVVFFIMMKFELGNLFAAFLGVLGLKIAAYLQPFTHKFVLKLHRGKEDVSESREEKIQKKEEVRM